LKAIFSLGFPPINATDSANQAIIRGQVSCNVCHSQLYKNANFIKPDQNKKTPKKESSHDANINGFNLCSDRDYPGITLIPASSGLRNAVYAEFIYAKTKGFKQNAGREISHAHNQRSLAFKI
jgi:hypothetical protein